MSDLFKRFDAMRQRFSPAAPSQPTPPDPELERSGRLHEWAKDRRCTEDVLPLLERLEHNAYLMTQMNYLNHAETSRWLGYAAGMAALREYFSAWRDNRTPAPHTQKGPLSE